jgi:hypothetical protein
MSTNHNNQQSSQNNILNTNVSYIANSSREEKDLTPVRGTSNSNIHKMIKHQNYSSISNNLMIEDSREITDSPKMTRGFPSNQPRKKTSMNLRIARNFTDKEKREILDHYKETFQLSKKEKIELPHNDGQLSPNSREGSLLPNISKNKEESQQSQIGLDSTLKGQMFKSSIYSLLLPSKINASTNTTFLKESMVNNSTSTLRSKSNNGSKLKASTNEKVNS